MHLSDLWFIAIAVLWAGYFVLEGFDFGVGILLPFLGRDDIDRRVMINTIGPVWDGNEVWLLTAGGATFAAFPAWYAALFTALYPRVLPSTLSPALSLTTAKPAIPRGPLAIRLKYRHCAGRVLYSCWMQTGYSQVRPHGGGHASTALPH